MLYVEARGKHTPLFISSSVTFQRQGCDEIFFLLYDAIIGGTKDDLLAPTNSATAAGRSLSFSGTRN